MLSGRLFRSAEYFVHDMREELWVTYLIFWNQVAVLPCCKNAGAMFDSAVCGPL
jgi:hypothetical protein